MCWYDMVWYSLYLFWAELMINQKGFKKSLMHLFLLSSLLTFFESEVASETERS